MATVEVGGMRSAVFVRQLISASLTLFVDLRWHTAGWRWWNTEITHIWALWSFRCRISHIIEGQTHSQSRTTCFIDVRSINSERTGGLAW